MATYASKGDMFIDNTIPAEAIKVSRNPVGSSAGLSNFWEDCPLIAINTDPTIGYSMQDNFIDLGLSPVITTIVSGQGRYLLFGGASSTIVPDAALGGGVSLTLTDDNQATSITTKQTPFQVTADAGTLWFEARVKTSTITTAEQAFFVGLMDVTPQTAIVPLTALGAIADINCVGFHKPEANTTVFDTSYKANGVTAVEVNSNVGTSADGTILAADTYIKLGMKFESKTNFLSFYINGIQQPVTKAIPDNTGTDFPADVTLAPVCAILAATADTESLTMDWWKCVQLR